MFPNVLAARRHDRRVAHLAASITLYAVSSTVTALAQSVPPPLPTTSTPAQAAPSTPTQAVTSQTVATQKPKPKPKAKPTSNATSNPPSISGAASTGATILPPITVRELSVVTPPPSRPTNQGSGQAIVVSPTTVPTPSDESASSTTVITASDIEAHQLRTVSDALATVPGLNIVRRGGPGGQTSVFLRGTNSNHIKVLIDGIDVSDPSSPVGGFDFGQVMTGDVERIEILRGPQSGLYGSDAIGGVISITTKSGNGPPKVTLSTEGGSFGTTNERASLSGSQADFNYVFNVQHFQSASIPVTPSYDLAPGEKGTMISTITGPIRRSSAPSLPTLSP